MKTNEDWLAYKIKIRASVSILIIPTPNLTLDNRTDDRSLRVDEVPSVLPPHVPHLSSGEWLVGIARDVGDEVAGEYDIEGGKVLKQKKCPVIDVGEVMCNVACQESGNIHQTQTRQCQSQLLSSQEVEDQEGHVKGQVGTAHSFGSFTKLSF